MLYNVFKNLNEAMQLQKFEQKKKIKQTPSNKLASQLTFMSYLLVNYLYNGTKIMYLWNRFSKFSAQLFPLDWNYIAEEQSQGKSKQTNLKMLSLVTN